MFVKLPELCRFIIYPSVVDDVAVKISVSHVLKALANGRKRLLYFLRVDIKHIVIPTVELYSKLSRLSGYRRDVFKKVGAHSMKTRLSAAADNKRDSSIYSVFGNLAKLSADIILAASNFIFNSVVSHRKFAAEKHILNVIRLSHCRDICRYEYPFGDLRNAPREFYAFRRKPVEKYVINFDIRVRYLQCKRLSQYP